MVKCTVHTLVLKTVYVLSYAVSLNSVVLSASVTENNTAEPTKSAPNDVRSLSQYEYLSDIDNEIYGAEWGNSGAEKDDLSSSLDGVYSECLLNLSFPCLQKKIIVFLDRLGKKKQVNLIGDFLMVVKTGFTPAPGVAEPETVKSKSDENSLKSVIDNQVDRFFETHALRVKVPSFLDDPGNENTVVVIDFGANSTTSEGRGKKGGKMKGMKKMMMMMGMMMCIKMAMMGPLMMGLIGLKAMKALILSAVSLTISKILLLKKLKGGGGGGGGGWKEAGGDSSGSGWDRSIESSYAHKTAFSAYAPIES